jgi:hypothetical protein
MAFPDLVVQRFTDLDPGHPSPPGALELCATPA